MTLGVRAVAVDHRGQVMLVRHTYLQVCFKGFRKFRDGECPLPASAPLAAFDLLRTSGAGLPIWRPLT